MNPKGYGNNPKTMCPYCGGMHPPGQCPMMMYPPAMPMPTMSPTEGMPYGGGMYPGMPNMPGMNPGMDMNPGMGMQPGMGMPYGMNEELFKKHHQMFVQTKQKIDEMYIMIKDMYLKMAKG